MIKEDFFVETYLKLIAAEERYFELNPYDFFYTDSHNEFEWDDKIQDSFLDTLQLALRTNLDNVTYETLYAYTFLYEYIYHDEEAELKPLQIFLLKLVFLLNPNKLLYRRRNKMYVPLYKTSWETKKLFFNRTLFDLLEDAFLEPEMDSFETKNFGSDILENPIYFKPYILKRKEDRFPHLPKKDFHILLDADDFYLDFDQSYQTESYLIERLEFTKKFKLKTLKRLNLLKYRRENSINRVKFFSIHKKKVSTPVFKTRERELRRLKQIRKIKLQRKVKDPDLLADLIDEEELPFNLGFFDDDYYETEFFNPHLRD